MRLPGLDGRTVRSIVALCLPTVCVALLGVRFLVVDVPRIAADERANVLARSEGAASALRENPGEADFTWVRGKGIVSGDASWAAEFPSTLSWKEWDPASGTKRREMWGWRPLDGGRLVWVRGVGAADSETIYARRTDIAERDYALTFRLFVPLFLFVLVGVTVVGIRYFIEYIRTRDDFLAATAHDLTTPLVGMRYAIGRSDADARVLNERMIRLVANIKDFLKLGGRRPAPQTAEIDLVKCYEEAYALFREDYRDLFDGADVPVEHPNPNNQTTQTPKQPNNPNTPTLIALGDETLTVQILWNLLGNDLKYAAPHGAVRVRFFAEGGFARVEFVDEGRGMTPDEMRRAFDRYYRAKTVLESGKGGFGIGLCTAREFAEAMGGSLTVRANRPRGCIFTLSLPAPSGARTKPDFLV